MVEMYSTISKNNNPLSKNKSRVKIGTAFLVKKTVATLLIMQQSLFLFNYFFAPG